MLLAAEPSLQAQLRLSFIIGYLRCQMVFMTTPLQAVL